MSMFQKDFYALKDVKVGGEIARESIHAASEALSRAAPTAWCWCMGSRNSTESWVEDAEKYVRPQEVAAVLGK